MPGMIKKRVAELEGAQLDWAVAMAAGIEVVPYPDPEATDAPWSWLRVFRDGPCAPCYAGWSPSSRWAHGGPIIERERIGLATQRAEDGIGWEWMACSHGYAGVHPFECCHMAGSTPLISAMRAFVESKLGDEVEVPE